MLPTHWKQFQASCSGNKCLSNKAVSLPLPPTQMLEVARVSQATPGNGINSFLSDQPGLIHFQADTVWQTWEFLPPKKVPQSFLQSWGIPRSLPNSRLWLRLCNLGEQCLEPGISSCLPLEGQGRAASSRQFLLFPSGSSAVFLGVFFLFFLPQQTPQFIN